MTVAGIEMSRYSELLPALSCKQLYTHTQVIKVLMRRREADRLTA